MDELTDLMFSAGFTDRQRQVGVLVSHHAVPTAVWASEASEASEAAATATTTTTTTHA